MSLFLSHWSIILTENGVENNVLHSVRVLEEKLILLVKHEMDL